jgi:hypothetical protein
MIRRSEQFLVELDRRQVGLQRRAPCNGGAQLRCTAGRHPSEPALDAERSQTSHAHHAHDTFRQQRAARHGVQTATGVAHHHELIDIQRVGDAGHLSGRRGHVPTRVQS